MKEYLISFAAALIITEILIMLMPDGGIKKFVRMAAGLLIMTFALLPVKSCDFKELRSARS